MLIFRKFMDFRKLNFSVCRPVLVMFLYVVVLSKVWGCCKKFSKFCHGELASLSHEMQQRSSFK